MFDIPIQSVFAALDMQDIISALFFIIMFLGWIFQAMASKNEEKNKPAPRRNRKEEKQKVENEISQFFEEINEIHKPKPKPAQRKRQRQRPIENDFDIELVEVDDEDAGRGYSQPQRSRTAQKRPSRKKNREQSHQPLATAKPSIESRALPDSGLGEGLVQHTEQYISGNSEAKEAHFESLGKGVAQSVSSHLGSSTDSAGPKQRVQKSDNIRKLLSDPQNIRQAMLINEILSKPISIR